MFIVAIVAVACVALGYGMSYQKETGSNQTSHVEWFHTKRVATVCETLASTRYALFTKGSPTFPNLDKAYPNQIFHNRDLG